MVVNFQLPICVCKYMRESLPRASRPCVLLLLWLAVVRISVLAIPTPSRSDAHPVTAFVNVNLVPMDREGAIPEQTVIVSGGRIAEIGSARTTTIPAGAIVVEGMGRYLMPGLADMHVHLDAYAQARPNFGDVDLLGLTRCERLQIEMRGRYSSMFQRRKSG